MNEFTPALAATIRTMADPDQEPETRHEAFDALWYYDDVIVPAMMTLLEQGDASSRNYAATHLGRFSDPKAVETLIRALSDENAGVRASVAAALGHIGDVRAVEPLIPVLRDKDTFVGGVAADALGQLGDRRAVAPLIDMLNSSQHYDRGAAAHALGSIGDDRALLPLFEALATLYDRKWEPHTIAIAISCFEERAVPLLIDALHNDNPHVRYWAAFAAAQIDNETSLARLQWLEANDHAETHTRAKVSTAARKALRTIRRTHT